MAGNVDDGEELDASGGRRSSEQAYRSFLRWPDDAEFANHLRELEEEEERERLHCGEHAAIRRL